MFHYYWPIRKPWSTSIMIYNNITIAQSIILTMACLYICNSYRYDKDHPRNFEQRRTQSFIDSHLLERDSSYRKIYDSDVFLHFISECVEERIYRWADPITRSVYSLQREGNELPWHFDRNEFTISLLVQEGLEGGKFEYAPMVRNVGGGKEGEEDYDAVRKIVKEGDRSKIKILDLCKGDIQIFRGRNTLHRVTPVEGERTRIIALPSYVKDPYSVGTAKQTDYFYGRHFPIHEERNKEAACANI